MKDNILHYSLAWWYDKKQFRSLFIHKATLHTVQSKPAFLSILFILQRTHLLRLLFSKTRGKCDVTCSICGEFTLTFLFRASNTLVDCFLPLDSSHSALITFNRNSRDCIFEHVENYTKCLHLRGVDRTCRKQFASRIDIYFICNLWAIMPVYSSHVLIINFNNCWAFYCDLIRLAFFFSVLHS